MTSWFHRNRLWHARLLEKLFDTSGEFIEWLGQTVAMLCRPNRRWSALPARWRPPAAPAKKVGHVAAAMGLPAAGWAPAFAARGGTPQKWGCALHSRFELGLRDSRGAAWLNGPKSRHIEAPCTSLQNTGIEGFPARGRSVRRVQKLSAADELFCERRGRPSAWDNARRPGGPP
jgi:hypothetical protein